MIVMAMMMLHENDRMSIVYVDRVSIVGVSNNTGVQKLLLVATPAHGRERAARLVIIVCHKHTHIKTAAVAAPQLIATRESCSSRVLIVS